MKKSLIVEDVGHHRIEGVLRGILKNTVAKSNTRHSIRFVCVEKNKIIATDGWKLVVVDIKHEIKTGLYFITPGGYLLSDPDAIKFPKYQDIMLKDKDLKKDLISNMQTPERFFSAIVCKLNQRNINFDLFGLQKSLMSALKISTDGECIIETISPDHPFQLTFDIAGARTAKITYLQMALEEI